MISIGLVHYSSTQAIVLFASPKLRHGEGHWTNPKMAPVTEIATIPLAAGATIEDPHSPAGKVWQSTLDTVSAQDGFQKAYYGREVEDPRVLQFFVGMLLQVIWAVGF